MNTESTIIGCVILAWMVYTVICVIVIIRAMTKPW